MPLINVILTPRIVHVIHEFQVDMMICLYDYVHVLTTRAYKNLALVLLHVDGVIVELYVHNSIDLSIYIYIYVHICM